MIPFAPDLMFLAPERFALLLVPLSFALLYVVRQRRRHAYVVRFTDPDLIDTVAPRRPGVRRHLVAAVYLTATALLVVAAARPALATEVANEPTVVLAFDTSISMEATDVTPSRIVAAREAAHRFIEVVPAGVRVGLVAFDQTARVVIPPTTSKIVLDRAIDRLSLGEGTAIGEAIYTSLDLLESDAPADAQEAAGSIVLMSDGDTTIGRPEGEAARDAQRRGVKVSTVAFGTDHGSVMVDFMPVPVPVDREALRDIAETTGGKVFEAESAEEVVSVFEDLGEGVGTRTEPREITDGLALAALVAAAAAAAGLAGLVRPHPLIGERPLGASSVASGRLSATLPTIQGRQHQLPGGRCRSVSFLERSVGLAADKQYQHAAGSLAFVSDPNWGPRRRSRQRILIVGCHAGGEVGLVVLAGVAAPAGCVGVRGDGSPSRRRHPSTASASGAAWERCPARECGGAIASRGLRGRLRHHGADRVPRDVRVQHHVRGDRSPRDRHHSDALAGYPHAAGGTRRACGRRSVMPGRARLARDAPQRAVVC